MTDSRPDQQLFRSSAEVRLWFFPNIAHDRVGPYKLAMVPPRGSGLVDRMVDRFRERLEKDAHEHLK